MEKSEYFSRWESLSQLSSLSVSKSKAQVQFSMYSLQRSQIVLFEQLAAESLSQFTRVSVYEIQVCPSQDSTHQDR